jgi:hypothetical protein
LLKKQRGKEIKYGSDLWTVELIRIYYQAALFYKMLDMYKFFENPFHVHYRKRTQWNKNEDVEIHGEFDIIGHLTMKDETDELSVQPVIIDLKLTGNIHSEFGDFCWGLPHLMNKTQPLLYLKLDHTIPTFDVPAKFMYWVFDKKTVPQMKPLEVSYSKLEDNEIDETIRMTFEKYCINVIYDWPEKPHFKVCEKCLLKSTCKAYINDPPLPDIFKI